ncbi:heme ABC transporter permease CcmC [Gammaproteobacteria bacterium]|nr:heme ABC transporter permease CcmC [Gammaproteobacteria bacterium]MDA9964176.1 heme ABC transporter permease CcmC [Gammaproteobacteria bacterium]MDB0010231.1 heme ABC transporter permease CcmC [Gammaproteobacteria bacterium]MDB2370426.1 heme ABC transporter permease CcmC [Gammaproteobacteria bacterium]MDC0332653.1 heme ABC transporter permease CcmC [Gammaproteobacteria bacterium]
MISAFIHKFSSPKSFVNLTEKLYPFFITLGVSMLMLGWIWGLLFAPQDAVQGNSYRIIFFHVPSVIFAELIYFFMAVCALMHIVWRVKLAAYLIKSAAPIGAMITFIGLFSGSIWGIPTWGTWWQWDARITSTLILFIMYLGVLTLHGSFSNLEKADRLMSILVIIGVVNIPIIKKSVDWWSTLHQPASISVSGSSSIDPSMLYPLLISIIGLGFMLISLGILSSRSYILSREKNKKWVSDYV